MLSEDNNSKPFLVGGVILLLCFNQGPAGISNHLFSSVITTLSKHSSNTHIAHVSIENERTGVVWVG